MTTHLEMHASFPSNSDATVRLATDIVSVGASTSLLKDVALLTKDELVALSQNDQVRFYISTENGIDLRRNARFLQKRFIDLGGSLEAGELFHTNSNPSAHSMVVNMTYESLSERVQKAVDAKQLSQVAFIDEVTTAAARLDDEGTKPSR